MSASCPNLESILKSTFRISNFRPGQRQILTQVLAGRDVLAIMPTGAGKSLCYQLPALVHSQCVVVISPLIALMKDQVRKLTNLGIAAGTLCSDQSLAEVAEVTKQIERGGPFVLFVSPERLGRPEFLPWLQRRSICLFAIDEAHCLSQWGHDFRPHYRQLACLRRIHPQTPILAVTATATARVQNDIATELGLRTPFYFRHRQIRDNLFLQTQTCGSQEEKVLWLRALLVKQPSHRVLIYCGTRKQTEEVADALAQDRLPVAHYHGGLSAKVRERAQLGFDRGHRPILVATNAFGMGVDYPDIRLIVHFQMPASLESLDQEIGRAGRDDSQSNCVMLNCANDWRLHEFLIKKSEAHEDIRKHRFQLLFQALEYVRAKKCRHQMLSHYFGDKTVKRCGEHCDDCAPYSTRRIQSNPQLLPPKPFMLC